MSHFQLPGVREPSKSKRADCGGRVTAVPHCFMQIGDDTRSHGQSAKEQVGALNREPSNNLKLMCEDTMHGIYFARDTNVNKDKDLGGYTKHAVFKSRERRDDHLFGAHRHTSP